ncbi:MAG: hypothetical protein JWR74_1271 [Polaromonas sp.]|jgi:hypothetical protein|nr:hypothetical protein [Polaromonas sp.]
MMMKQLIQKAKIKFFEPDGVSGPEIYRMASHLDGQAPPAPESPAMPGGLSSEQQRIKLLENQIGQLRADIARCKNYSRRFAHEMRDLLTD